jgi:uncharacterized protein (TIGR03435 family)
VEATTEAETSRDQMRAMLQAMLADRFKLRIEREAQAGTVYTLAADKPKNLKPPAEPAGRSAIYLIRNDSNGYLSYTHDAHNTTVAALAQALSAQLQAPVIDQTAITGNFDFQVRYVYDSAFGGLQPDPNVPLITTALPDQLGLKLNATKGSVPVYVVRSAAKLSPNP